MYEVSQNINQNGIETFEGSFVGTQVIQGLVIQLSRWDKN